MTEYHPTQLNIQPTADGSQIRMTFKTSEGDISMVIPNGLGPSVLLGVSAATSKNQGLSGRTEVALFSPKRFAVGLREDHRAYVLDFLIGEEGARLSFALSPDTGRQISEDLDKLKDSLASKH